MHSEERIQGSQSLSRYGDRAALDLTLGITRSAPTALGGLHRFEPVCVDGIASVRGNVTYPTRNFAQSISTVSRRAGLYLGRRCGLAGPPTIHLARDSSNSFDAIEREVIASLHQQEDAPELREVLVLSRLERVLHEEWDDELAQMLELADPVRHPVSVVAANYATAEEGLQTVQNLHIAFVLHDSEFRKYLVADFHLGVSCDPDVKAAFTVHEACHPSCI